MPTGAHVIEEDPFNASTPPEALLEELTPNDRFFVRNHFPVPEVDPDTWRLHVEGGRHGPVGLSLDDLRGLPAETVVATFECAGNGRRRLTPQVPGVQWDDTAVGTARWEGAPLRRVLEAAGVPDDAVEVAFRGLDKGEEGGQRIPFERSLPLEEALRPDVLLAYRMNGDALPADHGAPVRLLVPGWYGVASVKWLDRIGFLAEPFDGWFQKDRYVYRDADGRVEGPVDRMRVKALVLDPSDGKTVPVGSPVRVRGLAWAGAAAVAAVELSVDGGRTWESAELRDAPGPYAARPFRWEWVPKAPGETEILARAVDADGEKQPSHPVWNAHGYGQNGVAPRRIRVTPAA